MEGKDLSISAQSMTLMKEMQQNEINEWAIYTRIAGAAKDAHNKEVLLRLAEEERAHYEIWKTYTGTEMKPNKLLAWLRGVQAKLLGFTFTVKLMERGEQGASSTYEGLISEVSEAERIIAQEKEHESVLLEMLDEELLKYVGSMVLGLNDALVELTGTLAGLTFALANTRLVALSGLITGISATLSMASSEFLSAKSEGRTDAMKSCVYTGIAYVVTVALLILPYLIFDNAHFVWALVCMLVIVVIIILIFNFYISVAKNMPFAKRFGEMALISLGVAAISFGIGLLVKQWLGVDL